MAMNAGQVVLLRCEVNRGADLARAAGVKSSFPRVDATRRSVDGPLVQAAAMVAGYVLTLWEVSTVRALGRYTIFDVVYDSVEAFADAPSAKALEKHGSNVSLLIAAVAQLRGIADPCHVTVSLAGLVPPAPELGRPMDQLPAPSAPAPRRRARKFGHAILGGMSAATLALVGAAVWNAADGQNDEDLQVPW